MIPQMTVAANGNIYVAWPEADKVVLKKSADGGVTFSSVPTTVFNACTSDLKIEESNDNVYALCRLKGIDTPEGNIPGTKAYLQYDVIIFSKSIDQASTFSSPVTISKKYNAHTGSPDMLASGNKSLYIVWPDDANNTYTDIFFTKSTDNGETFANATNISNDKEDSFSPKIAVLGDNVFIAWQKIDKEKDSQGNDIDNGEIYLTKSTDNGDTFANATNISNDKEDSDHPELTVKENKVYVVWVSGEQSPSNILFAKLESQNNENMIDQHSAIQPYISSHVIPQLNASSDNKYTNSSTLTDVQQICNAYNLTCNQMSSYASSLSSNSSLGSINHHPVVSVGPDQTVNENATVVLLGIASDPDPNSKISYSWNQIAGPAVTLKESNTTTSTFIAPSNILSDTELKFALTSRDDKGATNTNSAIVTIKVKHVNPANQINDNYNFTSINNATNTRYTFQYQQQASPFNVVNGFVAINLKGADLTMQIPKNWFEKKFDGRSISFCSDSDCHRANMTIDVQTYNPTPGSYFSSVNDLPQKVFNGVLYSERLSGLQILQIQQLENNHQNVLFRFYDPVSGQDAVGLGVHLIGNGHLYVIHFVATKETWNSFTPIVQHITSTWHYNTR